MATIKEVADLAGVSIGTVSHVITGTVKVSETLRLKVQSAINKLDYHPNHVARSLKTSRTRTLGIIVPDLTISFFPQLIAGAESAAVLRGYSLLAVNSAESADRQRELLSLFRSQQAEGILLVMAASHTPAAEMERLVEAGIPLVCLDRVPENVAVDSVAVDDEDAAAIGTRHLLERGYRRIAIVTGPLSLRNELRRLRGYEECLRSAGLAVLPDLRWEGNLRSGDVAEMCARWLGSAETRPDALFCTNGPTALGALRAMKTTGLETPRDLGFVTFDELTVDDLFSPSITTLVQPALDIGHRAAEILLDRIQGKHSSEIATVRLPARLQIRESTSARSSSASAQGGAGL